jgi:hypothetical protein
MRTKPSTVKPWTPGSKRPAIGSPPTWGDFAEAFGLPVAAGAATAWLIQLTPRRARQHQPGHQATDRSGARDDPGPLRRDEHYSAFIERVVDNPIIGRACDEVRPGYRKHAVGSHMLY